jgi:hypothetical protein
MPASATERRAWLTSTTACTKPPGNRRSAVPLRTGSSAHSTSTIRQGIAGTGGCKEGGASNHGRGRASTWSKEPPAWPLSSWLRRHRLSRSGIGCSSYRARDGIRTHQPERTPKPASRLTCGGEDHKRHINHRSGSRGKLVHGMVRRCPALRRDEVPIDRGTAAITVGSIVWRSALGPGRWAQGMRTGRMVSSSARPCRPLVSKL